MRNDVENGDKRLRQQPAIAKKRRKRENGRSLDDKWRDFAGGFFGAARIPETREPVRTYFHFRVFGKLSALNSIILNEGWGWVESGGASSSSFPSSRDENWSGMMLIKSNFGPFYGEGWSGR